MVLQDVFLGCLTLASTANGLQLQIGSHASIASDADRLVDLKVLLSTVQADSNERPWVKPANIIKMRMTLEIQCIDDEIQRADLVAEFGRALKQAQVLSFHLRELEKLSLTNERFGNKSASEWIVLKSVL